MVGTYQVAPVVKNLPANAGDIRDVGLIPGLGISLGGGLGFCAQTVKNLPAVREIWVQSLGWEDPLEKEKATQSSILAWRIPWTI